MAKNTEEDLKLCRRRWTCTARTNPRTWTTQGCPPCHPTRRRPRTMRTRACAAPSWRENAVCPEATNAWFSSEDQDWSPFGQDGGEGEIIFDANLLWNNPILDFPKIPLFWLLTTCWRFPFVSMETWHTIPVYDDETHCRVYYYYHYSFFYSLLRMCIRTGVERRDGTEQL